MFTVTHVMSLQRHSRCQPGQADGPCEWEWFVDSLFHFSSAGIGQAWKTYCAPRETPSEANGQKPRTLANQ